MRPVDAATGYRRLVMALYLLVFLAAWVAVPLAVDPGPEGDNLEQLDWAQHPAWGYDKHPPLPTAVLWLAERVFPAGVPLTYALGGAQVALLLWLAWLIARQALDQRRATVAVLLISCVTYHTNRLHYYNHNTALLVACASSMYCVLRAAQTGQRRWQILLGVAWGLGLLSKYQMVIAIGCNMLFLAHGARFGVRRLLSALLLAGLSCALVIGPHLHWLFAHGFPSFAYASRFVAAHLPWSQRPLKIAGFLTDQALRLLPLALLLVALQRRAAGQSPGPLAPDPVTADSALTARLLAIHAWGPFVAMSVLALLFGVDLETHWGTAFLWVVPVWYLHTVRGRALMRLADGTILTGVMALQLAMLIAYR
jgi:4-amino-4-deoxy-L-arabinose transferase-like glycosyltransferase